MASATDAISPNITHTHTHTHTRTHAHTHTPHTHPHTHTRARRHRHLAGPHWGNEVPQLSRHALGRAGAKPLVSPGDLGSAGGGGWQTILALQVCHPDGAVTMPAMCAEPLGFV